MKLELEKYCINPEEKVIDALNKIDKNTKGFLLVIGQNEGLVGTLTDGDIRRSLIAGKTVGSLVSEICKEDIKKLTICDTIGTVSELFKNSAIKFLPIVDEEGKLINLITKKQMHSLLLQDIYADLTYNFESLDEDIVDHEIFQRPWGFYKTTVMNEYFQSKVISVKPGAQLSLQSHNHREEHWIIAYGVGTVQIGESFIDVRCGSSLFIPKGCKHRLTNTDSKESLVVTEVQIGDYFGEDDIIRYEDIYGRK
jgi:mannose-1-phosphate guanylyltransferase/mannose-6-phosphate isomerase